MPSPQQQNPALPKHRYSVCVSLFYVIDTGSIGSRARIEMGVTYLPFTVSSDAGYADLPLWILRRPARNGDYREVGMAGCSYAHPNLYDGPRSPGTK